MTGARDMPVSDAASPHAPVMLDEVLEALAAAPGQLVIDGTFGAGGYSRAILASGASVLALDRDPTAIAGARQLCSEFPDRLTLVEAPFSELESIARTHPPTEAAGVDAVVLDIGVSSMQLDQAARGFSFMSDGPLDMRMGADGDGAAAVVATASEALLADIIFHLGEDRQARRIARAIVWARERAPIATTLQLAEVVQRAIGRAKDQERHPATRTFQALRIWVNDELGELARALAAAERVLRPGGRIVVVTFHSLEDRIVKRFLARRAGRQSGASRHGPPISIQSDRPSFQIVNQRPLTPSQPEIDRNPRARSAKLRAATRTDAPVFAPESDAELGLPGPQGGWKT